MNYRGVLLVSLLGGAALLSATVSCSSADPQTVNFSERPKGSDVTSGGPTVDGGSSGGTEAGTEAGTDGGTSGGPVTAFSTAKPFNATGQPVGGPSTNPSHNFAQNTPVTNPAGQNCVDCHVAGGSAASAIWGFGGTVFAKSDGVTPVQGAEIRLTDSTGKEIALVYSDNLGNFWADTIVGGIPAGSLVGVRTAAGTKLMSGVLSATSSGCEQSGCHIKGGQGPINLQ